MPNWSASRLICWRRNPSELGEEFADVVLYAAGLAQMNEADLAAATASTRPTRTACGSGSAWRETLPMPSWATQSGPTIRCPYELVTRSC